MNIYVGNLAYDVQKNDLQTLFEQYGEVASASVITDRDTGQSKGFGFVEMPQSAQAQKAVAEVNGQSVQGRNVTVNEARPRERRPMRNSW